MKRADKLILAARIFDAVYQMTLMQEKDNNPEHWKTINGAHVHVDENGNYDGGAGGTFNGNHHYGPGYKPKVEADKKKAKENAAKQIKAWEEGDLLSELPKYREGESFKEWKRRDDKYQEERVKSELWDELRDAGFGQYSLTEEEYNKLTPEEILKHVNARYDGTEESEMYEGEVFANPIQREAGQKVEWEKLKKEYEREKEAEKARKEAERKRKEWENSEEGKAELKRQAEEREKEEKRQAEEQEKAYKSRITSEIEENRRAWFRKQIRGQCRREGQKLPTKKQLENLVNERYAEWYPHGVTEEDINDYIDRLEELRRLRRPF